MTHNPHDDETLTAAAVCARLRAARAAYDKATCATLLETDAAYEAALAAFSSYQCMDIVDLALVGQVLREHLDEESSAIAEAEGIGMHEPPAIVRVDRVRVAAAVFGNLTRLASARRSEAN